MHQKKLVSGSEACHISIIASLVLLCFAWEFDQDRKKKEKVVACNDAPTPTNGYRVCSNSNLLGSQCEFACNDYHRRVGALYTTCVRQPGGSLGWNNPAPRCEPIECTDQGSLNNGQITCTNGNFATSTCTFTCTDADYTLFPINITENTCLNDTTWSLPKPCCSRQCPPYALMDAVFVLDSSSSIGNANWALLKQFGRSLLQSYIIDPNAARLAVFRYNRVVDTRTQILLNEFSNIDDLLIKYDQIPYDGSGTRTGNALNHVLQTVFQAANGDRLNVPNIIVVITDGRSQDDVAQVSALLRQRGATIFVLGIVPPRGRLDRQQLNAIAGAEENVIIATSGFTDLGNFASQITGQICRDPCFGRT